jgi:hypothetical protein
VICLIAVLNETENRVSGLLCDMPVPKKVQLSILRTCIIGPKTFTSDVSYSWRVLAVCYPSNNALIHGVPTDQLVSRSEIEVELVPCRSSEEGGQYHERL